MRKLLDKIIDWFQEKFPPNRIVVLATAPVAALIAAGTAWLAQHFPGLPVFDSAQLTALALVGAGAVVTAAYKWLDGWQKHEQRVVEARGIEPQRTRRSKR